MNIEEKVVEVDFSNAEKETNKEFEVNKKNGAFDDITPEMISNRLEGLIQNHLLGFKEIVTDENFKRVSEEFQLNLVGLCSVIATQIVSQIGVDDNNRNGLTDKCQKFAEDLSTEFSMHPADITAVLLKVFTDILFQVVALEELHQERI